jgi:DNA/RNA-binding domain of Phe-tRNA-synthetase-like protein
VAAAWLDPEARLTHRPRVPAALPARSFRIDGEIFSALPGLQVVAVVLAGLAPLDAAKAAAVDAEWAAVWSAVHRDFGHPNPQSHPHIAQWRLAMRGVGASHKEFPTSVESLVRRALKQPEPFRVNPLVDFYNSVSLRQVVPAGAYDLDAFGGDLELRRTRAGDTFHALDAPVAEAVPPGELAYASGAAVLTRHLVWRQSRQALIHAGTRRAILISEILRGQESLVAAVTVALAEGARSCLGAEARHAVLDAESPSLGLS